LEKELKQKENAERNKEAQHREAEAAKQAINSFEREVTGLIQEKEIPKEQQGFVLKFFGVGNQANEIDITDRKAIKKLIQDGIKDKEAYDQAIIKAYREGKINVPEIGTTTTAPMGEKPKIMLKDARKAFLEAMQRVIPGG
jgi:regulator of protease activity HflC (stomatin/prohibitin superfamily)